MLMNSTGTLPFPTFLIIGAQKSATRWLRRYLEEHPEVFTFEGESAFFNTERVKRELEDYRQDFEGWSGEQIVGESTSVYMMWREDPVPRRVGCTVH
jgi:hypothetical protein